MSTPSIIFEDEHILVLDKPSGLVTNTSERDRDTLQNYIGKNFRFQISNDNELRSGIVHRLDKETSGVILVAKDQKTFNEFQKEFFERKVEKKYVALVHGEVLDAEGSINRPIGRIPKNRRKFGIVSGGREALTFFKVVKKLERDGEKFTLLELLPKSGRTHQIRVHLKSLGHPIVSDPLYVGRKTFKSDKKWCQRLFLHASEIKILGQTFSSPIPEDLEKVLASL